MLSDSEKLLHSTVRIECLDANGDFSCGTGFFFNFAASGNGILPAIVTNKHVIAGQIRGFFHLTLATADGEPDYGKHERIELGDFASAWIEHPDPNVDLAMCLIGGVFNQLDQIGKRPYYAGIPQDLIPTTAQLNDLNGVEEITMVGYPNGLWDTKNNLPIIRRGITATPAFRDYCGRDEFLIDAACFPGSSGSPVFILNQGLTHDKRGNTHLGMSRLMFIGILHSGPQFSATGQIVFQPAPTSMQPIPVVNTMMNLGICVQSGKVRDFEAVLQTKGFLPSSVAA